MRHSSRILQIFAILAVIPATALAGGPGARGPSVGGARGLLPVRPVVGLARGLSPIRPVVGTARNLAPIRSDAEGPRRLAADRPRHWLRQSNIAGGYGGLGFADPDFYGTGSAYAAGPYGPRADGLDEDLPRVLLAPPPCVHPQIITVGRSVHVARRAERPAGVRVVYGRPPCGAS